MPLLSNSRLSRDVIPSSYSLMLDFDKSHRLFSGSVEICINVETETSTLYLNGKYLSITFAVVHFGESKITPISFQCNDEKELLELCFEHNLQKGYHLLKINFSGKVVTDGLHGLYACLDSAGNETIISHFQSSFARYVFPCWDEPSFKAVFTLSVKCKPQCSCISNMAVDDESVVNGQKVIIFQKTPVMSTYLLGLAIGKFDYASATTSSGIPIRLFTAEGKSFYGKFGVDRAVDIIEFLEDFFQVSFMLSKLDIIAASQHAFVAMENWGVLIFREANILVGDDTLDSTKVTVTKVIGHELAHQWFGNLVTCDWWSDIWLNEGFAEWTEYLVATKFFPKRNAWMNFLTLDFVNALFVDSLSTAHALSFPVHIAAETAEVFDSITYAKGCSLVRMVYNLVGDQNFRDTLKLYLNQYAYKNASNKDLWDVFDSVTGIEISKVMESYVLFSGYPLLSCSVKNGQLVVDIETFSLHGRLESAKRNAMVSVKVCSKISGKHTLLSGFSEEGSITFKNSLLENDDLFIVNPGSVSLCRVSYSPKIWRQLALAISGSLYHVVSVEERFSLQNDFFALSIARYSPWYSVAHWLAFITNYAASEGSVATWKSILSNLNVVSALADECDLSSSFKFFVNKLLKPRFSALTWDKQEGEKPEDSDLRALLITALGFADDNAVISEAQNRFAKHLSKEKLISKELRQAIFSVVAFHGGRNEFVDLFKFFDEATTSDVREELLSVIGFFQDLDARNSLIRWLEQSTLPVSVQHLPKILKTMTVSLDGQQIALEFIVTNWHRLVSMCQGPSGILFGSIVDGAAGRFLDDSVAELLEVSFDNDPLPTAKKAVQQVCDAIRARAKWAQHDRANLQQFFEEFCNCGGDNMIFTKLFDLYFPLNKKS